MDGSTRHSEHKSNRFEVWGHGMLDKLKGLVRKRRKREASKKRRRALRKAYRD